MIFSIGTDIIEVGRVERELRRRNGFKEKVFARGEVRCCESRRGKARSYAARFAAKEAFLKALGAGLRGPLAFHEIEVVNDKLGKPGIVLRGKTKAFCARKRIGRIHVSVSHGRDLATAVVLLESRATTREDSP
ncbi:MAG: holo-ACP synthase [Elusimicrobia bacterium]|nr:holo-ACP synthase [Elusimicrobiota bacterium]